VTPSLVAGLAGRLKVHRRFVDKVTDMRSLRLPMTGLAVLVIVLVAWRVLPPVIQGIHERSREAAAKTATAAANAALSTVKRPVGLSNCPGAWDGVVVIPNRCWQGPGTPVAAAAGLRTSLKNAGASSIKARCVSTIKIEQLCIVEARLAGMAFHSYLAGPPLTPIGVRIDAGLGDTAIQMPSTLLPRYSKPIPIPTT
jgi:hypothetical protein